MKKQIILHIKCLWWDRMYTIGVLSVIGGFVHHDDMIFIFSGTILLCLCHFGRDAIDFYQQTYKELERNNGLCSFPYKNECYSHRRGRKWAIHDYYHRH